MSISCPRPQAGKMPQLHRSDLTSAVQVVRIYPQVGKHATSWNEFRYFGPISKMRFDHHPPPRRLHPGRGVMYGVPEQFDKTDPLDVAVMEAFQSTGVLPVSVQSHWLAIWRPTRKLALLDLADSNWLARAGGNAALTSGPRGVAREWSRAIYREYPHIDGLIWKSSVGLPGRALMLFERGRDAVPEDPALNWPLHHPMLSAPLSRIALDYSMDLV